MVSPREQCVLVGLGLLPVSKSDTNILFYGLAVIMAKCGIALTSLHSLLHTM